MSKNVECTLVKSELLDYANYLVTIRRQDGSEVHVMIPRENSGSWPSDCVAFGLARKPKPIYGLNLVTEDHYT
jgi:hypothetical protein